MAKAQIQVIAELPDDLIQAFIQHIRNFDMAHEDCHFRMLAKADSKTLAEMEAIFGAIDPPFERQETFKKQ